MASQVADGCCNPASAGPELKNGQCCYAFCQDLCCGRPLFVDGAPRLASVEERADWIETFAGAGLGEGVAMSAQARIAAEWLRDAQMEHASIASFARFVMDLLAFAAPPDLVLGAQRAGMDEVEHARASFAVASAYAGTAQGPGALHLEGVRPSRSLSEAAVSAFLEGCVGETTAALLAEERARAAENAAVRDVLTAIAADEARHAELAFRFVAWTIEQGGSPVYEAVAAEVRRLGAGRLAVREHGVPDPILRSHGRLSSEEIHDVQRRALSDVILPCARALLDRTESHNERAAFAWS